LCLFTELHFIVYVNCTLFSWPTFRYNCVSLGLTLWAIAGLSKGYDLLGAMAFTLALNYKQMSLYFAMPFFAYLLGTCLRASSRFKGYVQNIYHTCSKPPSSLYTKQLLYMLQAAFKPTYKTVALHAPSRLQGYIQNRYLHISSRLQAYVQNSCRTCFKLPSKVYKKVISRSTVMKAEYISNVLICLNCYHIHSKYVTLIANLNIPLCE